MLKYIILNCLLALPFQTVAQTNFKYPRVVLHCSMDEGGADLTEDEFGVYSYRGSYGFAGDSAGGTAKIELNRAEGKCVLKVSAGKGARSLTRSFSWTINPSGIPKSISEAQMQDGDCRLSLRYSKSIALCHLPTPSEPGSQCYGEAGKDLTALLPTGNSSVSRKLVAYSGGMTLEIDPGSQRGITIWRKKMGEGGWCYQLKTLFPYECKELSNRQEVKNAAGQIIGILEPQKEKVFFKQAKQPYSDTEFLVDSLAPSVSLMNSQDETSVIAYGEQGAELGRLTVLGFVDLPTRLRSFNKPVRNILGIGNLASDCNGEVPSLHQGSARVEKSTKGAE